MERGTTDSLRTLFCVLKVLHALRDATSLARAVPGVAHLEFATEETSISIGPKPDSQPSEVVTDRYTWNASSCPWNAVCIFV